MIKFTKVLSIRLVSLILAVVFSIPATAYSTDLSERNHLRPPPATSSPEGRERLRETLSEITYHEHVNKHINPQAEVLYKAFLQSKGIDLSLADNPENIALFYNSLGKYKDSEIAIMEIADLYKNTRILEHIGLGRFYGKPIIYIDKSLKGKEREEILQHAYDEITGWDKKRLSLSLEWPEMREQILKDYKKFQEIAYRIHRQSYNINNILKRYRAEHKSDLLIIIASMPFKEGDVVIAAGYGNVPTEKELQKAIRKNDYDFLEQAVPLLISAIEQALNDQATDEAHTLYQYLYNVLNALSTVNPPEFDNWCRERDRLLTDLQEPLNVQTAVLEAPDVIIGRIMDELGEKRLGEDIDVAEKLRISIASAKTALDILVERGILFKQGIRYYWNDGYGGGDSGSKEQAPESLTEEYLEVCRRFKETSNKALKEIADLIPPYSTNREERKRLAQKTREAQDEVYRKYKVDELIVEKASWDKKIEQYAVPDGSHTWYHWMKKQLGLLDDDDHVAAGSPQAVFNLLSNGQTFSRKQIADALGHKGQAIKVRTILPDLRFLVSAGLLIQDGRGEEATYVINPELSKNPDLIALLQKILDTEFKVLKTGWENKAKIREMIFEEALKEGLHLAFVLEKYKPLRSTRDGV